MRLPALEQRREGSLVVICPSCCRRYRHDFQAAAAQLAHCGACDERFEPVPPKRTYVLVPGGAVPEAGVPPTAIGMDDPLLAGKLPDASTAAGSAVPPVVRANAVTAQASPLAELQAGAATESPPAAAGDMAAALGSDDGPRTEARVRRPALIGLEAAIALVPCGLGAGLAYYFAGSLNQDPLISAILGGVTGLLLGWACMLWIAHTD